MVRIMWKKWYSNQSFMLKGALDDQKYALQPEYA